MLLFYNTTFEYSITSILLSANAVNLDHFKLLLFGKSYQKVLTPVSAV